MANNIFTEKWNLSRKWPYIRDMRKSASTELKEFSGVLDQNANGFFSKIITVSVLIFANLMVGLVFLLMYVLLK